nr:phosphoheptose isomerase [Actinomycetota bacterium]
MTAAVDPLDVLLERRVQAAERFFTAESDRLAHLCLALAERFERGGRLLA